MKYLKLFENFNSEDDLEDIKWILVELDDNPKLLINELDGNLLIYKVDHNYTVEENRTAEFRLNDLGYEILTYTDRGLIIIKSNYFEDKTINNIFIKLLNEKFGGMVDVPGKNPEFILYKHNDDNIMLYNKKYETLYLGSVSTIFMLIKKDFDELMKKWFKEKYNLNVNEINIVPQFSIV
jgi:hypothetical protein